MLNDKEQDFFSNERDLKRLLRTSLFWLSSTTIVWQLVSWVCTLFTARILSPTDYGIYAMVGTISPYLRLVLTFRIESWIIQTKNVTQKQLESLFGISLSLGLLLGLITFFLSPYVASFYETPELEYIFYFVAAFSVLRGFQILPESLLQREMDFKSLSIISLIIKSSRAIFTLVLAFHGYGFWSLILGHFFYEFFFTLLVIVKRGIPKRIGFDLALYKEIFKFGFPATLESMLTLLFSTFDDIVIGKFLGAQALGYYSMAYFLSELPLSKLNSIINPTLLPYYSRLKDIKSDLRSKYLVTTKAIGSVITPILLGIITITPEIVTALLGEKWLPMVPALRVLCIMWMVRMFVSNFSPLLYALGKPGLVLLSNAFNALVLVPSFYFLGKEWGLEGVFATWVIVYPLCALMVLKILDVTISISPLQFVANLGSVVGSSLLMSICVYCFADFAKTTFLAENIYLLLIPQVLVGAIVYISTAYFLFKKDFLLLTSLIKKEAL